MTEVNEQPVNTGNIPLVPEVVNVVKHNFKNISMIIAAAVLICLLIVYFILKQTSPIKPPEEKKQVARLAPTLVPLTISEKPQTEILIDIKDQLIKAFK
jgi:hypothetical protein